MAVAVVDASS